MCAKKRLLTTLLLIKVFIPDLLAKRGSSEETQKKCLLEQMLQAYILCNEEEKPGLDGLIFSSKLRRLLRLAVDLDQGAISSSAASGAGSSKGKQKEEHGITAYGKRVQPFWKRLGQPEIKLSHADSTTSISASGSTKQASEQTAAVSVDENEIYEPLSYLPQMSVKWSKTVQEKLTKFLENILVQCSSALGLEECLIIANSILEKHSFFRKCMLDLFGSKSLFSISLSVAVWKSVLALNFEAKTKLSYIFNVIISYYIIYESRGYHLTDTLVKMRSVFEKLRNFLLVTAGTNFCDVFEQLYVVLLVFRVTTSSQFSLVVEERMCKALLLCFPDRMPVNILQDIRYCSKLNARFLSSYLEKCDSVIASYNPMSMDFVEKMWTNYQYLSTGDFNVLLFRPGSHRIGFGLDCFDLESFCKIEARTGLLMREYELFFEHERCNNAVRTFSGKHSLSWLSELGYGVLYDNQNGVEITAKIKDCVLLLKFNESTEIHCERSQVDTLLNSELVYETGPNTYKLSDVIERDVNCMPSEESSLDLLWNLGGSLEEVFNRKASAVDCAVVRIMKHEKTCTVDALVEKTLKACTETGSSNKLYFSINFIRARIENQIRMGYIKRKDNAHKLEYIPEDAETELNDSKSCDSEQQHDNNEASSSKNDEKEQFTKEFLKSVKQLNQTDGNIQDDQKVFAVDVTMPAGTETTRQRSGNIERPNAWEQPLPRHGVVADSPITLSFSTNMMATTITSEFLLSEIRTKISKIAGILEQNEDRIEALMLTFDWNSDKLIDSYLNDQAKTLAMIGIECNAEESQRKGSESEDHCPICMTSMVTPGPNLLNCNHVFCLSCWTSYLTTQLDQHMACSTTCPIGSCQTRVTTRIYHTVFENDAEKRRKYDVSLVRSFVESDRSYSWCHNPRGCDRIVRKSQDGREEGWCSECGWQTCFTCAYVEAHLPASCSHMSQWTDDGGYYEGMSEDAQSKHLARLISKRCPNCQANIEKNDGCLHMKCIKCSHDFCWRCLQPWRPTHRDYYNCSSKVSKLAQSNTKFVEFNKRCQHHNMAKTFAYSVRDRLMSLNATQDSQRLKFAVDMCTKLAYCRRTLAYCNVFNFYSTDTDKMNNIGLHSVVLENKTLLLQEHWSEVLLSNADIEHMVSVLSEDAIAKGSDLMNECSASIQTIVEFSKQDMKLAMPCTNGGPMSESDFRVGLSGVEDGGYEPMIIDARPAGLSDEDDNDDDDDMSGHSQSYNGSDDDDDDEDDNVESEEEVNMYSSDDDDDNEMHYDGRIIMDFDSDDDNRHIPFV